MQLQVKFTIFLISILTKREKTIERNCQVYHLKICGNQWNSEEKSKLQPMTDRVYYYKKNPIPFSEDEVATGESKSNLLKIKIWEE